MSERTTIGGTVYEVIGSSSSNLLLKCNGTAKIQWGTTLIDLIKNGKIASGDSSVQIFVITDKNDIKYDGIYIIENSDKPQLLICKNGEQYDLTESDLYISATTKQDLTEEQKNQTLKNIGFYYQTLDEAKTHNIKNGLVYILDTSKLYTIQNGVFSEFKADIKTVTVEPPQETQFGDTINGSVKIVLSVNNIEYMVLSDSYINVSKSIQMQSSAQLMSEGATADKGYRLYTKNGLSYLDIDSINVRKGLQVVDYITVTFKELQTLVDSETLQPHSWYLLSDFKNPWKLTKSTSQVRPILIRALTNNSFYNEGKLFKDQRVIIHYDFNYQVTITQTITSKKGDLSTPVTARGQITWMKDSHNNEANFDFLDYRDADETPLGILHTQENAHLDDSVFPKNSYNNILKVNNLSGITIDNSGNISTVSPSVIEFFEESAEVEMHDNEINCYGLILGSNCKKFIGNDFYNVKRLTINADCVNTTLTNVWTSSSPNPLPQMSQIKTTEITSELNNVTITRCVNSNINSTISNSTFHNLTNCTFDSGELKNITCFDDLSGIEFSQSTFPSLYDTSKHKEIYVTNGSLNIIVKPQQFTRGMIIMYDGKAAIPDGWAICDGKTHVYNGETVTTPNLIGNFIKAVGAAGDVKQVLNTDLNKSNEFILTADHLPEHSHPHTHTFSGTGSDSIISTQSAITDVTMGDAVSNVEGGDVQSYVKEATSGNITMADTVNITISGTTSNASTGSEQWENKAFKIEPNYYALIFIMKL